VSVIDCGPDEEDEDDESDVTIGVASFCGTVAGVTSLWDTVGSKVEEEDGAGMPDERLGAGRKDLRFSRPRALAPSAPGEGMLLSGCVACNT
jgi:hypothetical protein